MGACRRRPRGILTEEGPRRCHIGIQVLVAGGIGHVDAVAQHRHHLSPAPEGAVQGSSVHPVGAAADHQDALAGQGQTELPGSHHPVGTGLPGPHNGHHRQMVQLGQGAFAVEDAGGALQLPQPLGIGRILHREDPDPLFLALGQDGLGWGQVFVL